MKDEIKYLNKFKEGEDKIITLPKQEEEKGTLGDIIKDMKKSMPVSNKIKFKINKLSKLKVNDSQYEWGYGHRNYDGEGNWRLFIFDSDGRKIYNEEPVDLYDFDTDSIREIINKIN